MDIHIHHINEEYQGEELSKISSFVKIKNKNEATMKGPDSK